jgi:prepilin-type N-terminal cleavage/methylation domain-containing protein
MKKGFTLIELLVVIVIIGILVAIALPNFIKIKDKAKEAEVKQNLHAIQLAVERYSVDSNSGFYPYFIMGGDWTDSYVVWQEWADLNDLDPAEITKYAVNGTWIDANVDVGDTLVMESYMPQYPGNPFKKSKAESILPVINHMGFPFDGGGVLTRYVGGKDSNCMYEVFGPTRINDISAGMQSIGGDFFVHHIFNNPPYQETSDYTKSNGVDWNTPSGNSVLVGNFSYFIRPNNDKAAWAVINSRSDPAGYTLAGYGSHRTPGQDVYNRNGNYMGRYRTEPCGFDCGTYQLFGDDIPCICDTGEIANPNRNNGGSDTLADGVVITLDSGVDKKSTRVNFEVTEGS